MAVDETKAEVVNIILGATARSTLEDFVIAQAAAEAETAFGMSPGSVDISHVKSGSIHWEDDGEGGTQCRVAVRFEKAGQWSPT